MTDSEFISIISKSVRDPSKLDWGEESLEAATFVAKTLLVDLVPPDEIQSLQAYEQITLSTTANYGYYDLSGLTYTFQKDIYLEKQVSYGERPYPFRRIRDVKDVAKFKYKYSGATEEDPVYTVVGNMLFTLGLVSGACRLWYIKEPATIDISTNPDNTFDIPLKFLKSMINLTKSVIADWEGNSQEAIALYQTEYQILTGKKLLEQQQG